MLRELSRLRSSPRNASRVGPSNAESGSSSKSIRGCGASLRARATGVFIPPQRRRIGFLFQDYALFSHLTVAGNIRYGLRGLSANEQRLRTSELLERFQLQDLAVRHPHQLSGGQKQRVALARTL